MQGKGGGPKDSEVKEDGRKRVGTSDQVFSLRREEKEFERLIADWKR